MISATQSKALVSSFSSNNLLELNEIEWQIKTRADKNKGRIRSFIYSLFHQL